MPFALIAKFVVPPERVLQDPEIHDMLHHLVVARFIVLRKRGLALLPTL